MKYVKYSTYPKLRRAYSSAEEMGETIFKSSQYIYQRMNGKREFTHREKVALLEHIGKTAEDIPEFFPERRETA